LSAAITGYACLEWMLHHFHHRSLKGFTLYRLLQGGSQLVYSHKQANSDWRL